jgi:hypothetical protein
MEINGKLALDGLKHHSAMTKDFVTPKNMTSRTFDNRV